MQAAPKEARAGRKLTSTQGLCRGVAAGLACRSALTSQARKQRVVARWHSFIRLSRKASDFEPGGLGVVIFFFFFRRGLITPGLLGT